MYLPTGEGEGTAATQALYEAYPPGSGMWGFNYDHAMRPYVEGEAELDVEGVVRAAVTDPAEVEVVPRSEVTG